MVRHRHGIVLTTVLIGATECVPPARVPTRPAELLPRLEIQINNTATQSDDYVLTLTATPARIRVLNVSDPPVAVDVTLKNLDFQTRPSLVYAASGAPTLATLDITVPGDGSWAPFVIAGVQGQLSVRDKDAVIETLERRADGIVLGRKSLMVTTTAPIPTTVPQVELRIGGLETIDDYIAWRPVAAFARLVPGSGVTSDVPVTIRNMSPVTGGGLVFGPMPQLTTNTRPPTMATSLNLTLPMTGGWIEFFMAGNYGQASSNDKDAVMEVVRAADGQLLGREGMMVRVRKNANALTVSERDRYLYAVSRLNLSLGNYLTHQQIHNLVSPRTLADQWKSQGHHVPAFLAWHRAFILRYERELQAIDPAVALHYWRFDQAAPNVFSTDFMGGPPSSGNATFNATNPLSGWAIETFTGIARQPGFTPTQSPTLFGINSQTTTLGLGGSGAAANYDAFRTMESNPHDQIHGLTGGAGWIAYVPRAVRDPLFFMLHSNIDRLWAKWQFDHIREDPTAANSYAPQGTFVTTGSVSLGQYAEDNMWPWDLTTGFVTPGDPLTQRPPTAPGGSIPAAIGGWGPRPSPRPRDVVDFDQWTLLGSSGLGFGYDDVPFIF